MADKQAFAPPFYSMPNNQNYQGAYMNQQLPPPPTQPLSPQQQSNYNMNQVPQYPPSVAQPPPPTMLHQPAHQAAPNYMQQQQQHQPPPPLPSVNQPQQQHPQHQPAPAPSMNNTNLAPPPPLQQQQPPQQPQQQPQLHQPQPPQQPQQQQQQLHQANYMNQPPPHNPIMSQPPPPLQQQHQQPNYMQQPPSHYPNLNHQPPPPQLHQHQPNYMQQAPPQYPNLAHPPRQMKLDQHLMPSAAQLIKDQIDLYKSSPQFKSSPPASLPPLVTTLESQKLKMIQHDDGCVRPCHMRSTIYQVPITKELLDSSGLEMAIVVKPFDQDEVERKIYTPLSTSEIIRCNRCKAYINPFSRQGQCCICKFTTHGVQELDQKPELYLGSYEFRVTPEYYRDGIAETRRPHIIFAIEMTAHSRHMVEFISQHLANVIRDYFPSDFLYSQSLSPLVGFATYNSKITLYDVKNGGHAFVISDLTAVTDSAPTSNFLIDPVEDFEIMRKFLSELAQNETYKMEQETVLGPVIEAVLKTCFNDQSNQMSNSQKKAIPTGKIYLLHSSLPSYGDDTTPGRLTIKRNIDEMKRSLGTENESKVLAVEGKYYTQLAQKCINDYASGLEIFLFPPDHKAFCNIATLGELTKITGTGSIHKYQANSLQNFIQDLQFSLKSTMGFDASMRVRTSTGISPVRYVGNFNNTVGSNLEMSAVNTNSNFVVQMKYDDKLPENDLVVVQFAMIYTSVCGERRVRVHNLALETCQTLADLYKSACCDTLVNVLLRDTIEKMRAGNLVPKAAKEQLTARAISILAAYRKHCTENHSSTSSQLILPEGLKLLPVYLCGALKCDAIDGGMEMFPDDKVLAQLNLMGALPSQSQVTVYPRMYSIEACEADDEENEHGLQAVMTRCYNLALEEAKGQCYILENGHYLFLYFPNNELGQQFLANVFGIRKDDRDLEWGQHKKDSNESNFLEELLAQIVAERRRALKISVVRQGKDKVEHVFKTFLYEDKKRPDGMAPASKLENASYVDLLCYLHTEIRSKLSQ